jgi:hypothetical protein
MGCGYAARLHVQVQGANWVVTAMVHSRSAVTGIAVAALVVAVVAVVAAVIAVAGVVVAAGVVAAASLDFGYRALYRLDDGLAPEEKHHSTCFHLLSNSEVQMRRTTDTQAQTQTKSMTHSVSCRLSSVVLLADVRSPMKRRQNCPFHDSVTLESRAFYKDLQMPAQRPK